MRKIAYALMVAAGLAVGLAACADQIDPLGADVHPEGWADPGSANFHGQFVLESAKNAESCTTCHGENFGGGTSEVSCMASGCHSVYPHPDGFALPPSEDFHGMVIADRGLWDLALCRSCHGADYAGEGDPEKNCLACHAQDDGPEACNTCHGGPQGNGPPPDLLGRTSTMVPSVGAHTAHAGEKRWTSALAPECSQCHRVPDVHLEEGHLDGEPPQAEVIFKLLASRDGRFEATYDPATATCSNTYCHGDFAFRREDSAFPWAYEEPLIVGNNATVVWTELGAGQAECGTCHDLPPQGHIPATTCAGSGCHSNVFDAAGNLIDKGKHINGRIDVE